MRYVPFPRFLGMLEGELTFTPLHLLRSVNDPLECHEITDPVVIITLLSELPNGKEVLLELKASTPPEIRKYWDSPKTPRDRTNQLAQAFHRFVSERRAASCWFANGIESAAMWSSFALNGVAVRTDLQSLEAVLPTDREFLIASVRYRIRERLEITPGNFRRFPYVALRPFLVKGREFQHEQEVRFITRCSPDQKHFCVDTEPSAKYIQEVIISPYLDYHSAVGLKRLIKSLLKKKFGADMPPVNFSTIKGDLFDKERASVELDALAREYMPADLDTLPL